MFDRLWNGWLTGLFFEKDDGAGGAKPEDSTEDEAKKKKAESDAGGDDDDKAEAKEKKFSQAELDAIVKDRLDRERKKTESATAKAKQEAEEEALKKNQEWQTLAEQRQTRIVDLEKEAAELSPYKEQAEKYKGALDAQLAERKKTLPKFILPLIEKMDPVEAMQYLTEHAEELGVKPETYSETPEGKNKKVTDADKKSSEQASGSIISRSF